MEQNAVLSANVEKVMERLNDVLMEREEVANEFRRYKASGPLSQQVCGVSHVVRRLNKSYLCSSTSAIFLRDVHSLLKSCVAFPFDPHKIPTNPSSKALGGLL